MSLTTLSEKITEFTELRIRGVKFSYREDQLAALNLQEDQEILVRVLCALARDLV